MRLKTRQYVELTILMPCLNEAETLAACIDEAQASSKSGIDGEVLIADNGAPTAPSMSPRNTTLGRCTFDRVQTALMPGFAKPGART
jgi:hypothetical protein